MRVNNHQHNRFYRREHSNEFDGHVTLHVYTSQYLVSIRSEKYQSAADGKSVFESSKLYGVVVQPVIVIRVNTRSWGKCESLDYCFLHNWNMLSRPKLPYSMNSANIESGKQIEKSLNYLLRNTLLMQWTPSRAHSIIISFNEKHYDLSFYASLYLMNGLTSPPATSDMKTNTSLPIVRPAAWLVSGVQYYDAQIVKVFCFCCPRQSSKYVTIREWCRSLYLLILLSTHRVI